MSCAGQTTPITEMLGLYRRLSAIGSNNLTAHLGLATEFGKRPEELSARFALSVSQFARYHNPGQGFHDGDGVAPIPSVPEEINRTVHFAAHLAAREQWDVAEAPDLAFGYVDREPDIMRTFPGQPLDDGTPSKKAMVLDLLLRNARHGTPIVAELKIKEDENAFYGLVQGLAAAAHLVSASQRIRLTNTYGLPYTTTDGPYLDVYVILFRHPMKGVRPEILERSKEIRNALIETASVSALLRRIEFLHSDLIDGSLTFEVA